MFAAAINLSLGNDIYVLLLVLPLVAFLLYYSKGVNFALTQFFVTTFIIILINITFHGEWYLALYRIVDVAIGAEISFSMAELLNRFSKYDF